MTVRHYSFNPSPFHRTTSQIVTPPYDYMLREYERRKAAWVAQNPQATPAEYEAGMQEICRELGV